METGSPPKPPSPQPRKRPIPPRGALRTSHDIARVPFGLDVTIRIRSLNKHYTDGQAPLLAFAHLCTILRSHGVDPVEAAASAPSDRPVT